MAVSPKKILKQIQKNDSTQVADIERRIDEELSKTFDGNKVILDGSLLSRIRKPSKDTLLGLYRANGWDVKESYDNRDSTLTLTFTVKPQYYDCRDSLSGFYDR